MQGEPKGYLRMPPPLYKLAAVCTSLQAVSVSPPPHTHTYTHSTMRLWPNVQLRMATLWMCTAVPWTRLASTKWNFSPTSLGQSIQCPLPAEGTLLLFLSSCFSSSPLLCLSLSPPSSTTSLLLLISVLLSFFSPSLSLSSALPSSLSSSSLSQRSHDYGGLFQHLTVQTNMAESVCKGRPWTTLQNGLQWLFWS